MSSTRDTILSLVRELRRLDRKHRVFGARVEKGGWGHGLRFNKPLRPERVIRFERRHGIELPADYREFLTEVGDGGAGPHYGVRSLAQASESSTPSGVFPWVEETKLPLEEENAWLDSRPGILVLAEQGCGHIDLLVVSGRARHQVWSDSTVASGPLTPCADSFTSWYVEWATRCIKTIKRERLVKKIRIGMTVEELHRILGAEEQLWPPGDGLGISPPYVVEFANTNATFSVGQDGRVRTVNRGEFI